MTRESASARKRRIKAGRHLIRVRFEQRSIRRYQIQYSNFGKVAFLTSTPAGFTITKTDPTKPENGELRAFFYKKNAPYGTPSPNYPITLS